MKCSILHESAGRLRVRLHCPAMTLRQADVLEYYLRAVDGVTEVKVYDRTRDAVVCFACGRGRHRRPGRLFLPGRRPWTWCRSTPPGP